MLDLIFKSPRRLSSDDAMGYGREWETFFGRWLGSLAKTNSGIQVGEDNALTYSAVWCATRVIAETCASLPLIMYERDGADSRSVAGEHPLYSLLHDAPNPDMTAMAFKEGRFHHQVNWGNAFAEIEWDSLQPERRTKVVALWPIHPGRVAPVDSTMHADEYKAGYRYRIANDDSTATPMRPDEILHIPGVLSEDGIWGKGVISHARESIGMGLATERHGATAFGANNVPRGVLFLPGMNDSEKRKSFRKEWKELHGSPTASDVAIIPAEGKFERFMVPNEDLQFLGTRGFNVTEIARWYRVPPHMIMDLARSTNNNIEHQGIEFVVYSILPWLVRWEQQINLKLLLPRERKRYYSEHLLASLLRGDMASRYAAYLVGIQNGFLTINDVRRFENMNPIGPAGDQHFVQLNMTTAEAMLEGPPPPTPPKPAMLDPTDNPDPAQDPEMRMAGLLERVATLQSERMIAAIGSIPAPTVNVTAPAVTNQISTPKPEVSVNVESPTVNVAAPNVAVMVSRDEPAAQSISRETMLVVLEDACSRWLSMLGNAAKRKATSPDFEAWLDEFAASKRATLQSMLCPSAAVVIAAGRSADTARMADGVIGWSSEVLRDGYASATRDQFAEILENFSGQAKDMAAEILNNCHAEARPNG